MLSEDHAGHGFRPRRTRLGFALLVVAATMALAAAPAMAGTISISDVSQTEGNSGTKTFTFHVSCTGKCGSFVTYQTKEGSASEGSDYVGIPESAPASASNGFDVNVSVNGDRTPESDETFDVVITCKDSCFDNIGQDGTLTATGTIRNDDFGSLSINDVAVREGNGGTANATFTVSCDTPPCADVDYATRDGSATQGTDYQPRSGTLNFGGSVRSRTIAVPIVGDTSFEPNETFAVVLSGNGPISDANGQGTIINDDGPPDGDGDGIPDSGDACPTVFALTPDGCPAPVAADGDQDGVPDAADACPTVPASTPNGCPATTVGPSELAANPLSDPILFRTYNAEPLSGRVLVAVPGGAASRHGGLARAAQLGKGLQFVPLQEARQLPIGTYFDTRRGRVGLTTASTRPGVFQSARLIGGIFQALQRRRQRGVAEARLAGGKFTGCPRAGKARAAFVRVHVVRRLSLASSAALRARGRTAIATSRGSATWTVTDRCDGTLTRVRRGRVVVRRTGGRRGIVVRTGKSVLVRTRR